MIQRMIAKAHTKRHSFTQGKGKNAVRVWTCKWHCKWRLIDRGA